MSKITKFITNKQKQEKKPSMIKAFYSSEFKKCYIKVFFDNSKLDYASILEKKGADFSDELNDFIFKLLEGNDKKTSNKVNITVNSELDNKKLSQFSRERNISYSSRYTNKEESKIRSEANKAIRAKRKSLLKKLKDYKNNIMVYTDASIVNSSGGAAAFIIDDGDTLKKNATKVKINSYSKSKELEIFAFENAMKELFKNKNKLDNKTIILTTDSDYLNEAIHKLNIDKKWNVKFPNFCSYINDNNLNIEVNLIKSHQKKLANKTNIDFRFNEEVDKLANEAARKKQTNKQKCKL